MNNPSDKFRPRVSIVTERCFLQCDVPILPSVARDADVDWNVFLLRDNHLDDDPARIEAMGNGMGVATRAARIPFRLRSWRAIPWFSRFLDGVRRSDPDLVYVNALGMPWLAPVVRFRLDPRKVVWAVHDFMDHERKRPHDIQTIYRRFAYRSFDRFHFLSRGQLELFRNEYPSKTAFLAHHAPLDLGERSGTPDPETVRFLFFGVVTRYKGLDVLIRAADELWESGVRGFKVDIAGRCQDWEEYRSLIRNPEAFETDIRTVPDERVVELYSRAHWLVLPYRDVTQSGPMSLAYHYNVPTITSDIPGFGEFVEPGGTGIVFRSGDPSALARAMREAIDTDRTESCRRGQAEFFRRHFSLDACVRDYRRFLLARSGHDSLPKAPR